MIDIRRVEPTGRVAAETRDQIRDASKLIVFTQTYSSDTNLNVPTRPDCRIASRAQTASVVEAITFDCRHSARLNRLPTICLQALSTTPDPTGNPRSRRVSPRRSPALRQLWQGMPNGRASRRFLRGAS